MFWPKREKHRRRAKARGEKEGKNGSEGGGGGGGLLRPRSYFAFPVLVPLGPEPGIAPVPSAVVQTGALPVELINLTRAIDVSLLKRYGACDIFSDISVPSFFPFIF